MKSRFNKLCAGVWKRNTWIVFHSASRKCSSIEKIWLSIAYTMWFRKKGRLWDNEFIWTRVTFWIVTEIQLFKYTDPTPLHFVCGVGCVANCARVRWIHETNCSFAFWMLLPAWRHVKADSNNNRNSHRSCRVHCGWRWDFGTFIVKRNRFIISV